MNNKLKELSRYCCKPANEQGYEFVKTCARLGGVEWNPYGEDKYLESGKFKYVQLTHIEAPYLMAYYKDSLIEIPVTQFCDILLKDEREFDDRVDINYNAYSIHQNVDITPKEITAREGYKFKLSEDSKTVEMVKDEVKCGFCVKPKNEKE